MDILEHECIFSSLQQLILRNPQSDILDFFLICKFLKLFRFYEILFRKNEILFRIYEIVFRFYEIIFRFYEIIISLKRNNYFVNTK